MNEHMEKIRFRINSLPRTARNIILGMGFMILGVALSRYNPNVIYFIFAACFSLLGLVLFMMGVIGGFVDIINHFRHKNKVTT